MSGFQAKMSQEVRSLKTNSVFVAQGTKEKAFLVVNGEAATNRDAMREAEAVMARGGEAFDTVVWRARMLARVF